MPISRFGSEAQKSRYLPGVVAGDTVLTAALTEEGIQDPARPRTAAKRDGDTWVLEGTKVCVPAITRAEAMLVPAQTPDGVTVFIVDPKAPGIEIETGIGNHHQRLGLVKLSGVRLAAEHVLGEVGDGAAIIGWLVERARTALCALQLGVCEEALRRTAEYTSTRKQFGKEIGAFQGVSLRAADGYIDIECMRSTLWLASWRLGEGLPAAREVASAKWWACDGGSRVVHSAMHLHGGTGADAEYPIHRFFLWQRSLELELGGAGVQLEHLGGLLAAEAASA
jgi:alkylation response protein AidB-like acyl-CoA dehydrogenase